MSGVRLESNGAYWSAAWKDSRGRIMRKSLGPKSKLSRSTAKAKCLDIAVQHRLTPGARDAGKAPPLGAFLSRYFEDRAPALSEATLRLHECAGERLKAHFGEDTRLDRITRDGAAGFRRYLGTLTTPRKINGKTVQVKLSDSSVRGILARCKVIFGYAVDLDLIPVDPFAKLPSGQPRAVVQWRYVPEDEAERIIERCPDQAHRLLIALCRYAGLRRGEALRLTWADVDVAGKRLTVVPGSHRETTKQRLRTVPIVPRLLRELVDGLALSASGYPRVCDMPLNGVEERVYAIVQAAGVPGYGKPLHTLRKSCESDWLAKFPVMDVCGWLGHDPSVAAKHYHATTGEVFARVTEGVEA